MEIEWSRSSGASPLEDPRAIDFGGGDTSGVA